MSGYANEHSGGYQQGAQQVTENYAGGSSNNYYQQSASQGQLQEQQLGQRYNVSRPGENMPAQYNQQLQGQQTNAQQQTGHMSDGRMSGRPAGQQLGAGEPAQAAEQDGLHKCGYIHSGFPTYWYKSVLDRIEKKFGGERFNNPDNYEKNKKLNNSLILKLKQVGKIVM
jgi:hypothetical protein